VHWKFGWKALMVLFLVLVACLTLAFSWLNQSNNGQAKSFNWNDKNYIRGDGLVRANLTLDWHGDNLTITLWINDDDFQPYDYVGLVFDADKDGDLFDEVAYLLYAGNCTPAHPQANRLEEWGGIYKSPVKLPPEPSAYHYCTFADGYTFHVEIPKKEVNFTEPMLMHFCFFDEDAYSKAFGNCSDIDAKKEAVVWDRFEVGK
jgi:hypothetical protein